MVKILTIEDHKEIRDEIVAVLRWEAFEVYEAADGREGLQLALQIKPDLILCDIMMPELDGYELFQQLAAHSETASIPFVFLTARTDPGAMRYGMNLGADDYVTKPFNHSDLLSAIRARLEKHQKAEIKQLKALSQHLIEVQDSERQQMAQFLQNELEQRLSGLKMSLSVVRRLSSRDARPILDEAQTLLDSTLDRVQIAESQFWPMTLNQLGLLSILLWQINQFMTQTNIPVRISHTGLGYPFSADTKIAIFRILQEILDKVEQDGSGESAEANQAFHDLQISVAFEATGLELSVDGVNIEARELINGSYPLLRLRERVAALNGTLEIRSSPRANSLITITIPLGTTIYPAGDNPRANIDSGADNHDEGLDDEDKPTSEPNVLTRREREIVQLIGDGRKNSDIADTLGLSVRTVETHRANIMQKLGLHSKNALIFYALQSKP